MNRFDESVANLRDQFPDDLSEEDWNTLANVLLAYIWNDRLKSELKRVEQDFLDERSGEFKQIVHDLRADYIAIVPVENAPKGCVIQASSSPMPTNVSL
jgi:hypothetical protein